MSLKSERFWPECRINIVNGNTGVLPFQYFTTHDFFFQAKKLQKLLENLYSQVLNNRLSVSNKGVG